MRRWFRRKGKDTDRDEENGTTPLVEETGPGPEATGEEALAESEPEAQEAAPAQTETDSSPQRRGFLRRWRREAPPEDAAPPALVEGAGESEAVDVEAPPAPPLVPLPPRSRKPRPPSPPPSKPSRLRRLRSPRRRRHIRKYCRLRTWRRPGRFPRKQSGGECSGVCGNGWAGPGRP